MENAFIISVKSFLNELKDIEPKLTARADQLKKYSGMRLNQGTSSNGSVYFCVRIPGSGKLKYVGNETKEMVRLIQESRFVNTQLDVVRHDIKMIESFLKNFESISFNHINSKLPKAYKNKRAAQRSSLNKAAVEWKARAERRKAQFETYKPEQLVQPTIDGNKVRSKSEAFIYNYLFEHGYTFVYELPLNGRTRKFCPDFTILSEIDYKTVIYIEHQGMFGEDYYRNKAYEREYDYWRNGFLPSRDVFFTFDDCKGGFDIEPLINILKVKVRPPVELMTAA